MRISDWSSDVCSSDLPKPWAGHPRHHRAAESAIRLVAGSKQVRITHPSVATVRRIVHDIGCASEEEAAVANVPDSPRGTPAAESGGQYEKRTHRLTRGGGGFHSRSAGFGESIRKGRRSRPGGIDDHGPSRSFERRHTT